jgi:hypothetical protein
MEYFEGLALSLCCEGIRAVYPTIASYMYTPLEIIL